MLMRRLLSFTLLPALLFCSLPVQAADLMDWLEDASHALHEHTELHEDEGKDAAVLLTLTTSENEMYPKISPDESSMFTVAGKRGHQLVDVRRVVDGERMNIIADYEQQVHDSAAWYGDDQMTFLSYRGDSLSLWQKQVEGGKIRRLNRRIDGELRSPQILTDGSLVAVRFKQHGRHRTPGLTGDRPVRFENWQQKDYQQYITRINELGAEKELAPGSNPALSPDGNRLVFTMQDEHYWHLFLMNIDGSDRVQLTEGKHIDTQPTWSRDGKWIAFTSNRSSEMDGHHGGKDWDIWLIGRDGRDMMRLTADAARDGAPMIANGHVYFHSDRAVEKSILKKRKHRGRSSGFHIWVLTLPAKVS